MKVNGSSDVSSVGTGQPAEKPATAPAAAQPDKVSTDESARLSQTVSAVRAQVGAGESAKLAAIENAVRQGTYRPDPARIAEQILQDAEISASLQAMLTKP
ncbi:MAG TPA: flagellar biosynthesis anti-sigma factor FlgM [Anaeromyxobacteraceae bacterium]|nr:flagellar biosynthesis anti-sigma factor FlgM [Anaeromyxobacteraceae bacterium]